MKKTIVNLTALILLTGCGTTLDTSPNPNTASSSSSSSSASTPIATATEKQDALSTHNNERKIFYNNGDLIWSDTLEKSAQDYANTLAQSGEFKHSGIGYGENLYASSYSSALKDGIVNWINEKSNYTYSTNSCKNNAICGHYTQVIWENTTEVGCARAIYKAGTFKGGTVIVCQYNPAGNYVGQKPY